jgi:TrmH family RNA methyltransferase
MTSTIANPRNPRLQALRRLQRRRERDRLGRFAVEGEDLIEAAATAGRTPIEGYRTPDCRIGDASFIEVEPEALASACVLGSGARAVAVYEQRFVPAPVGPLCLYLHGLSDPGNVGACMRSAYAFGASCVALSPQCADPHSPKAVRASMGAIFAVPLAQVFSVEHLPGRTVALAAHRGEPLEQAIAAAGSGREGLSVLVGAEREGLPQELIDACERVAHIPIASESLNAAMAATVALYEIARHFTRVRTS